MKSRESALRLKRFEAQEKARKVLGLEQMIRDFEVMASDLDRQVQAEEDRTGVRDTGHFNYSTFAKAASQRRDKLRASIEDLKLQLEAAVRERDEVGTEATSEIIAPQPRDILRGRRRIERSPAAMVR
jgi:flagellar FliJ protein